MSERAYRALAERAVELEHAAQKPEELEELAEWLAGRPPAQRVLEIGVYLGGTAWLWRQLWPRARLVGVDLHPGPCAPCDRRYAHRDCPKARLERAGMSIVVGDSSLPRTAVLARALLLDGPADFLHIDADHGYPAVRRDFELYAPLVARGGAIVLHDVAGAAYPGCVRFWQELGRDHPGAFLIHTPRDDWGGLGVLPL